jgi:hypothetical protein
MPLQNRVTPSGEIIAVAARGLFMGNRGCLHDRQGRVVRHFRELRWLICLLNFKNRKLELMKPGHYTPLFFLHEVTALAAGHRPCAECRRPAFNQFIGCWPDSAPGMRAAQLDEVLHGERMGPRMRAPLGDLPGGVFVRLANDPRAFLLQRELLLAWTPFGYEERIAVPDAVVEVLTPPSAVEVLRRGYKPEVHPSANDE